MAAKESTFSADVQWSGSTASADYTRNHTVAIVDQTIRGSATAAYGGDSALANPEQLFAAAIAQCQMLTYLALAAKTGLDVVQYTDHAEATIAMQDRKMLVATVVLHPTIKLAAGGDASPAQQLVEKAHGYCFIANSVTSQVTIEPTIETA